MSGAAAADRLANLVKRVAANLTNKASSVLLVILNNKNAGTFGALAGFALAIVFAWKFLRSSDRPTRRKRPNAPPSSSAAASAIADASSSEAYQQLLDLKESEGSESASPVELTLGQVVRKKLNGGRKITCQLLGIILEEKSSEELQRRATVRPEVVEVLLELSRSCDLYLMETVEDDESEERALIALDDAGLFKAGGLVKEKVLFCSTKNGRTSFVRQLEPDWHIDSSAEIVYNLARFIRFQLHVTPAGSGISSSNIFTSESLENYFSCM